MLEKVKAANEKAEAGFAPKAAAAKTSAKPATGASAAGAPAPAPAPAARPFYDPCNKLAESMRS